MALAAAPSLLLLDEPLTGMDAGETAAMVSTIERIRGQATTIMLVELGRGTEGLTRARMR